MMNTKVFFLLILALYEACGGGGDPPIERKLQTNLPDEESINENVQDQGVGGSGLHPSSSAINLGPTINYALRGGFQGNNSGRIYYGNPQAFAQLREQEPNNANIRRGPTINIAGDYGVQCNNSGEIYYGEFSNEDDNSAPSTLAGELSEPPNEENLIKEVIPISEDTVDTFQDTVTTRVNSSMENLQDNYIEPQASAESPQQESVQSTYVSGSALDNMTSNIQGRNCKQYNNTGTQYRPVFSFGGMVEPQASAESPQQESVQSTYVSGSALDNMTSNIQGRNCKQYNNTGTQYRPVFSFGGMEEPQPHAESPEEEDFQASYVYNYGSNVMTSNTQRAGGVQHVNTGTQQSRDINFNDLEDKYNTLNGSRIVFQGETLLIGDHKMLGVNAKLRPLTLKWDNGQLFVNGIHQPALNGIEGRGTWYFYRGTHPQ